MYLFIIIPVTTYKLGNGQPRNRAVGIMPFGL